MSSTTNGISKLNTTHDTSQGISQDLDVHIRRSSHSGLSALLNAVTLHIAKSDETKHEADSLHNGIGSNDSDDGHRDVPPYTVTPTMVPEGEGAHKHTFTGILMTLLLDPDNADILTFLPDGKYFALRKDEFAAHLMRENFKLEHYESFLDELSRRGFSAVETKRPGIEVYRHPLFRKGDWERCGRVVAGEQLDPSSAAELPPPVSGSNSRTSSLSEDDLHLDRSASSESAKRRLSPASAAKTDPATSSKLRINFSDDESASSATAAGDQAQRAAERRRSVALSLTSEKLNIRESDDTGEAPLVQQAVSGATHTIVTDAIEALLRDEEHSRMTFEKHADELSKSSLPGLVPISRQLFASRESGSLMSSSTPTTAEMSPSDSALAEALVATAATMVASEANSSGQRHKVDEDSGDAGDLEKTESKP